MRKDEFPIIEKHVQNEINAVLDKIRAEIQTEVTHWLNRRDFYDDWKHIDLTGTPWLEENKHRNIQEIACARYSARAEGLEKALEIIDTHISALNNDQFEGIWQNTVKEMKRRKIEEDILEEAEKWDSETMSGSLLTDDDLRQLIGDGISRCKEREKEQDKVTQWINDNADFIREMARMLEEADTAESEEI